MKDNSFGSAAPKSRSINVGANLLGEWLAEQSRLRRDVGRFATLLGGSLFVAALTLPVLLRNGNEAAGQVAELRGNAALMNSQLEVSERAQKAAQPALVVGALCARTRGSLDRLLGQMERVMNAGNSRMALSSVRLDVQSGEAHLVVQGDAEEDGAADAFARNVDEEGAKVAAITNSRPSQVLGSQGMGFQYEKRIRVDQ